jgi:hypothetical protein
MRSSFLALALLLLASFSANATTSFGYSGEPFDIQFVGQDFEPVFNGVVEISGSTGPRTLPSGSYKLTSYVFGKSLRLEFSNNGDPSLPRSFVLTVSGNTATLQIDDRTIRGHFSWEG